MSVTSRAAAVAGTFYPDRPEQLSQLIDNLLAAKSASPLNSQQVLAIKALIVPHAGLIYSGAVAASAYRLLKPRRQAIQRVVLLGPNHRVPLRGLALPSVDQFTTHIG